MGFVKLAGRPQLAAQLAERRTPVDPVGTPATRSRFMKMASDSTKQRASQKEQVTRSSRTKLGLSNVSHPQAINTAPWGGSGSLVALKNNEKVKFLFHLFCPFFNEKIIRGSTKRRKRCWGNAVMSWRSTFFNGE